MAGPSVSKGKPKSTIKDKERQSRSRSVSVIVDVKIDPSRRTLERSVSPYLSTSLDHPPTLNTKWTDSPISDLFDEHTNDDRLTIPSAKALNSISERIESTILESFRLREERSHDLMAEVSRRQKDRTERDHQRNIDIARREDERKQMQLKKKNATPKKRDRDEIRPHVVGSHGVARQDGKDANARGEVLPAQTIVHSDLNTMPEHSSPMSSIDSHPASNPDTTMKDADDQDTSDSESEQRQPPPAASIPQFQIFGDDPSQYPDATIYEIREITDDMSDEEKKEIYAVARFPASDLLDKTAGTAPDRDFSNAKPTNQVNAQTFANFVEPYLRPLTQEDLGFLVERQDRVHIFEIPKRGRHYKEVWAEEDGTMFLDQDQDSVKMVTNEPRGDIDQMNDDVAESDDVSTGPVTARWLALTRPLTRPEGHDSNGLSTEMDIDGEPAGDNKFESQPPATAFPESTWKNVPHPVSAEYGTQEQRLLEELRHIGFLSASDVPNFVEQQDDEVTARLRYLQRELNRVSLINGARKARTLEIAEERMAAQEWQGISDDLDTQLNQAYLKRNRTTGKNKKQVKKPGTAAPVGVARSGGPGVGEPIRSLLDRRTQWNDLVGPVVNHGQVSVPKESIFDQASMDRLIKVEQENWVDNSDDL